MKRIKSVRQAVVVILLLLLVVTSCDQSSSQLTKAVVLSSEGSTNNYVKHRYKIKYIEYGVVNHVELAKGFEEGDTIYIEDVYNHLTEKETK